MRIVLVSGLAVALFAIAANAGLMGGQSPMAAMVIGAMGKDCENLYNKISAKIDEKVTPILKWLTKECKKCGKGGVSMQEAWKYRCYLFNEVEYIIKFMSKGECKLDAWKMCPEVADEKVYNELVVLILKTCVVKKPIMNEKDVCNLMENKEVKETIKCIKKTVTDFIMPKVMPPPMQCVDNVKPFCDPKHHKEILGWIDMWADKQYKNKDACKDMKDVVGNEAKGAFNPFCALQGFWKNGCKPESKYTSQKCKIPNMP